MVREDILDGARGHSRWCEGTFSMVREDILDGAMGHSRWCERTLSMVREEHTECRKSLCAETITAFLQCKMNFDADCCDFAMTPAMLCEAKHATTAYNREHENK